MNAPAGRRAAAVLFDLDGLLVDSEPLWTVAEEELAARLGGVWVTELKAAVVGTRMDVSVPTILRYYGAEPTPLLVADTERWLLARMCELFAERLALRPGAGELLAALAGLGVPLALVSSSYRVLVDAALARFPGDPFATTLAGDEVARGKPHPEPYLTACARLGVHPAATVVLEDSPAGVAAGEAAGCRVVAVPSVTPIPPTPTRPVLASLHDADPAWLLALPAAGGPALTPASPAPAARE